MFAHLFVTMHLAIYVVKNVVPWNKVVVQGH